MNRWLLIGVILAIALSTLAATATSASAKGKPFVVVEDPFTFTDLNPCTGELHDITMVVTLRIHEFESTDPDRHHFNIQFSSDITTSDGFLGSGIGPDVDNGFGLLGEETGGTFDSLFNAKIRSDAGQIISVHLNLNLTFMNGEWRAEVDHFSLTCVGKPA